MLYLNSLNDCIILGIDPGINITGFGIIEIIDKYLKIKKLDILNLKKYKNCNTKLEKIFEKTLYLIDNYHPNELSIESTFFGKNPQSTLKLGKAQGMAIAAGIYRKLPIIEYSPKKIKKSITGNGSSSKEQVSRMLEIILNIKKNSLINKNLDISDGLATAVCHCLNKQN